jgi:hypothetical protein
MNRSTSGTRPKVQLRSVTFPSVETLEPAMRYVDLHSQTPWTTSVKTWGGVSGLCVRTMSAPLSWRQELQAALKPPAILGMHRDEEDPFAEESRELEGMRKSVTKINKFYIPISKLPPLGGADPRLELAKGPPSCAPDYSVPRAQRVMQRWQSMPQLRSQLPKESLQVIEAACRKDRRPSLPSSKQRQSADRLVQQSGRNSQRGSARREDTNARLTAAFREMEEGSARGKKETPHIPCSCCDHKVEKPWMAAGCSDNSGATASSRAPTRDTDRTRTPGSGRRHGSPRSGGGFASAAEARECESDLDISVQGQRAKNSRASVSWEDRSLSDAESEHWEAI